MICPMCKVHPVRLSNSDETATCIGCCVTFIVRLEKIISPPMVIRSDYELIAAAKKKAMPKEKPEYFSL